MSRCPNPSRGSDRAYIGLNVVDVVLDPTCGSGSSMVAAKQLGRQYVGFETDLRQVEHARSWLSKTETPFAIDGS